MSRPRTVTTADGKAVAGHTLSKQRRWQLLQVAKGRCETCGLPSGGFVQCGHCQRKQTTERGHKSHHVSGLGHPPERCGDVSSQGDLCHIRKPHHGAHNAVRPGRLLAKWLWTTQTNCKLEAKQL